jgi:hypothetical protein
MAQVTIQRAFTQEITNLNLGYDNLDSSYCSVLLLRPSSNNQDSTQNQALTTFFHITSKPLFMTIWRYTVSLLIPALNEDKGKAVPICTIKVCVGGWVGAANVLLHSYYWYWFEVMGWMNEERGVRYLAQARGVSLVLNLRTSSVTYTPAM